MKLFEQTMKSAANYRLDYRGLQIEKQLSKDAQDFPLEVDESYPGIGSRNIERLSTNDRAIVIDALLKESGAGHSELFEKYRLYLLSELKA